MNRSAAIAIRLTDVDGRPRDLSWPEPKLHIGSHPSSGMVLQGRGVSEYHCVLEHTRDGYVLRDRGSRAGTFVNSERLTEPRALVPGDRIYVGEYQVELLPPPEPHASPPDPPPPVQQRRGRPAALHRAAALAVLASAGLAVHLWRERPAAPEPARAVAPSATATLVAPYLPAPPPSPPPRPRPKRVHVTHEVAPGETIAEIAARYGVSANQLIDEHGLNPDQFPDPGTRLTILAVDPPLPKLRLAYTIEPGDTWSTLAERFDVGIEHLQRANPDIRGKPIPGTTIQMWVDPQIELRHDEAVRVSFPVVPGARSIGAPSQGRLDAGIQLPPSRDYERVNPRLQYASSHTLAHLQWAIARFRQLYRYKGVLVLSDLSREGGGPLPPHKSHQSGRDIDIWLPALKGTYLPKHIQQESKPTSDQVNWYAAWGLVESLLATEQVQYIFLERSLHARLYAAADSMGADPELRAEIQNQPQEPDPELAARRRLTATIRHADGHLRHIHVRFACPKGDDQCLDRSTDEAP